MTGKEAFKELPGVSGPDTEIGNNSEFPRIEYRGILSGKLD